MKPGATFVGEITLHRTTILNHGPLHHVYFREKDAAIFATSLDGGKEKPVAESFLEFSDGTFLPSSEGITISKPPTKTSVQKITARKRQKAK